MLLASLVPPIDDQDQGVAWDEETGATARYGAHFSLAMRTRRRRTMGTRDEAVVRIVTSPTTAAWPRRCGRGRGRARESRSPDFADEATGRPRRTSRPRTWPRRTFAGGVTLSGLRRGGGGATGRSPSGTWRGTKAGGGFPVALWEQGEWGATTVTRQVQGGTKRLKTRLLYGPANALSSAPSVGLRGKRLVRV